MITKIHSSSVTPPNVPATEPVKAKPSFTERYRSESDVDEFDNSRDIDSMREENEKLRKISKDGGPGSAITKGLLAAGTGAVAMATASLGWGETAKIATKLVKSGTVQGVVSDVSKMSSSTKKYAKQAFNYLKNLSFVKKATDSVSNFMATNSICVKIKNNKILSSIVSTISETAKKTKVAVTKFFKTPEPVDGKKMPSQAGDIGRKVFSGAAGITAGAETLGIKTDGEVPKDKKSDKSKEKRDKFKEAS